MTPTKEERAARSAIIAQVQTIANNIAPGSTLELFGSQSTQLADPTSDLDFRLRHDDLEREPGQRGPSPTRPVAKRIMLGRLWKHFSVFNQSMVFYRCEVRYGQFPLVQLNHYKTGLEIQIVSCNDTVSSREYVKSYLTEFPALRPLYLVVKTMLSSRGLNDVFKGGLGSYSIFMMVVASLKFNSGIRVDELGRLLLSFLRFYSELDTYKLGVSVDPPSTFEKRAASEKLSKDKIVETQDDPVSDSHHIVVIANSFSFQRFCSANIGCLKSGLGIHTCSVFRTRRIARTTLVGNLTPSDACRKPSRRYTTASSGTFRIKITTRFPCSHR